MSVLIVGLSGVTNGGKSTLANYLKKVLPSYTKIVKQDDYFLPTHSPLHVPCPGDINHHNWDVISSVDMDTMVKDIRGIVTNMISCSGPVRTPPLLRTKEVDFLKTIDLDYLNKILSPLKTLEKLLGIILIDGFTIYDDSRIREIILLKFFLTLPKDECLARRENRVYDPPDPEGYFDACVWPMYEEHLAKVRKQGDVYFYDGTKNIEDIFLSALKKIVDTAVTL